MEKVFSFLLAFCVIPSLVTAQWNSNTAINTSVAVATKSQGNIHTVTDGNGGAIMAWDDNRNSNTSSTDIYAQRLDKHGNAKWTLNGVALCSDAALQKSVNIIESDKGSAILTWEDLRAGNYDIYAQKIDSSGTVLWTSNGIAITNKLTTQRNPKIIGDNAGGAIIVWEDSVNFYYDVYAQRINSAGVVQWTANGIAICTASNLQMNPKIDTDGGGGGIITWQDKRNTNDYDIYAQRIDSTGTVKWTNNGIVICNAINTQSNPRIEPDGNKGAIIAWVDKRSAIDYNVYAQRIDSTGAVKWSNNGVVICSATGNQSAVDLKYLGTNGAIVSWKDFRSGANQIYSQLINLQGTPLLTANGILLSNGLQAINPNAISAGQGTAIIVWQDSSATGWDIKSQKLSNTGTIQWINGGTIISNATGDQINASNVSDGTGGAIYAWEDHRNTLDYDVYAQHVADTNIVITSVRNLEETILKTICYPNPVLDFHSTITIISKNKLEQIVKIYNSTGQLTLDSKTDTIGICAIDANLLSNGFYIFKIESKNNTSVEVGNIIVAK